MACSRPPGKQVGVKVNAIARDVRSATYIASPSQVLYFEQWSYAYICSRLSGCLALQGAIGPTNQEGFDASGSRLLTLARLSLSSIQPSTFCLSHSPRPHNAQSRCLIACELPKLVVAEQARQTETAIDIDQLSTPQNGYPTSRAPMV